MARPSSTEAWIGVCGVVAGALITGAFSLLPLLWEKPDEIALLREEVRAGIRGLPDQTDIDARIRQIKRLEDLLLLDAGVQLQQSVLAIKSSLEQQRELAEMQASLSTLEIKSRLRDSARDTASTATLSSTASVATDETDSGAEEAASADESPAMSDIDESADASDDLSGQVTDLALQPSLETQIARSTDKLEGLIEQAAQPVVTDTATIRAATEALIRDRRCLSDDCSRWILP